MFFRAMTIIIFLGLLIPGVVFAQEEESAALFTQAYNDKFQEYFFEALKAKGIENYDKAINLLLECKQLEPDSVVVDYELGRNHYNLKQYQEAESYFLTAVEVEPDNRWYLSGLLNVYRAQSNIDKAIEVARKLYDEKTSYQDTLIELYMENGEYQKAMETLNEVESRQGKSAALEYKRMKINSLLNYKAVSRPGPANVEAVNTGDSLLEELKVAIKGYQDHSDYANMLKYASEGVDNFPAQPEFYYYKGVALRNLKRDKLAEEILEEGLMYIVDDPEIRRNFYLELIEVYKSSGNEKKLNEYKEKLKENRL